MKFTLTELHRMRRWANRHIDEHHGGDDRGWADFEVVQVPVAGLYHSTAICCIRCGAAGTKPHAQHYVTDYEAV